MFIFRPKKFHISDFWSNTLANTIGTIVGIVLTFGTSHLIERHDSAVHEHDAALMVINNIERYCYTLDEALEFWEKTDSLNSLILAGVPQDSAQIADSTLHLFIHHLFHRHFWAQDNTAQNIFNSNIEIWQDISDKHFIENVGQCFHAISLLQEMQEEYYSLILQAQTSYKRNIVYVQADDITLKQHVQRTIKEIDVKLLIGNLHNVYLPIFRDIRHALRESNAQNKKLMNISDKELNAIFNSSSI